MSSVYRGLEFFLGGNDLEMEAIRDLLRPLHQRRITLHDLHLSWGARTSDYGLEAFLWCSKDLTQVVLVELIDDLGLADLEPIVVDHHGARAGTDAPTSLEQVFALLDLPRSAWTRWHELVAANDRSYIPGLLAVGATREEIEYVRAADRAAQGVTTEQEAHAAGATAAADWSIDRRLTIVRLQHNKAATVADRLHAALGGPGVENLVVLSPGEVNVMGDGVVVQALVARFPGGWWGGDLPRHGYWGSTSHAGSLVVAAVEDVLRGRGSDSENK